MLAEGLADRPRTPVRQNMVAPNELEINPPSFQPKKDLTEDDVQKAIKAVSLARNYSQLHSS